MEVTKVKLTIKNPQHPKVGLTGEFLVDTGAHYTVLPQSFVKKLKLKKAHEQEFVLADGKIIKRPLGGALIKFEDKELPVAVVLG